MNMICKQVSSITKLDDSCPLEDSMALQDLFASIDSQKYFTYQGEMFLLAFGYPFIHICFRFAYYSSLRRGSHLVCFPDSSRCSQGAGK